MDEHERINLNNSGCNTTKTVDNLIAKTFPKLKTHYLQPNYFSNRAILTPLNKVVREINTTMVDLFPGSSSNTFISYSTDCIKESKTIDNYPLQ